MFHLNFFFFQLIPIETSMAENRHRFPLYLHFAVGSLSVILGCFGILGYTVYGEEVNQIVTESFPSGVLIQVVRCLLCFAILLTYPLQVFPVIEIIEGWLFKSDNNTAVETSTSTNSESSDVSVGVQASESSWLLAPEIPKQKSLVSKKEKMAQKVKKIILFVSLLWLFEPDLILFLICTVFMTPIRQYSTLCDKHSSKQSKLLKNRRIFYYFEKVWSLECLMCDLC